MTDHDHHGNGASSADIVRWSEHERGGHFAAAEVPDIYVNEVRSMFGAFRAS